MPRPYHSPSSLAAGDPSRDGCEYAWALTYVEGVRTPDVAWADIEAGRIVKLRPGELVTDPTRQCTPKQYSSSLGKALHDVGERYFRGLSVDWTTLPAQIYASGIHLIPKPGDCSWVDVESEIGDIKLPDSGPNKPTLCLGVHDLRLAGRRDLVFATPGEGLVLVDYKSTSNILVYSKTREQLESDVQACAYALDLMRKHGVSSVKCRWVYFETRDARRATPVDFVVTHDHAERVLCAQIPLAQRLDSIQSLTNAKRNPFACEMYGKPGVINCAHHISNGGLCDYRRPLSALIQLANRREKAREIVDEKEQKKQELMARLAKAKADKAAAAPAASAPVVDPAPEAPKPTRMRKPAAPPEPTPEPASESTLAGGVALDKVRELIEQLQSVTDERNALQSELDAIVEALS